eukprot:TRINITY_DN31249_c0_g1_i1.p1 TRINITY_DN31249_c0_g1~~TRINITY_DN31249_c0_g1_i1.p1  ORF type:complete len:448 (-),score=90.40 TRINITY_DN31249_c0_g1_i1:94-1311(-)
MLAAALGIRHIVVLIGNLDCGKCSVPEQGYQQLCANVREFLDVNGFASSLVPIVPVSRHAAADDSGGGANPVTAPVTLSVSSDESLENGLVNKSSIQVWEWYDGPSLAQALSKAAAGEPNLAEHCLRIPLFEFYKLRGSDVVAVGKVEAGTLRTDAELVVSPGLVSFRARRTTVDRQRVSSAHLGDVVSFIGVRLEPTPHDSNCVAADGSLQHGAEDAITDASQSRLISQFLQEGAVVSELNRHPAKQCQRFRALLTVFAEPDGVIIKAGYQPILDVHMAHVPCAIASLSWRRGRERLAAAVKAAADAAASASWGAVKREGTSGTWRAVKDNVQQQQCLEMAPTALIVGDVAEVWLEPMMPVCLEVFCSCPPLGRFGLRDGGITLAAGVVVGVHFDKAYEACFSH